MSAPDEPADVTTVSMAETAPTVTDLPAEVEDLAEQASQLSVGPQTIPRPIAGPSRIVSSPVRCRDYAKEPAPAMMTRPSGPSPVPGPGSVRASTTGNIASLRQVRSGQSGSSVTGAANNVKLPPSLQAKMQALANRSGQSPSPTPTSLAPTERFDPSALLAGSSLSAPASMTSSPSAGPSGGLARRRANGPGLNLNQLGSGAAPSAAPSGRIGPNGPASSSSYGLTPPSSVKRGGPPGNLRLNSSDIGSSGTPFANFNKIVDPSGKLNFDKKAVLHAKGVDFSNGSSFSINMDELTLLGELGRGNYGTVQRVYHKVTKVTMAMKEIRLELDDAKLKTIITELDILHRATAPEIIDFYGAFFVESCVYYCMEYMDAGSLEQLGGHQVPEDVLARITASMVRGLKFLKDELQTMHRDVKPTNVLANRAGAIKLCDFGVSGQLERSLAKTNIGCQSYMAPERIKGESQGQVSTYTVSSDVWSLGLSIIEFSLGHYPYPPETYSNVFAQLQAIVHGEPPKLAPGYSQDAIDFVAKCLHKVPHLRPTYAELLDHPFLRADVTRQVDMVGWIDSALQARAERVASVP